MYYKLKVPTLNKNKTPSPNAPKPQHEPRELVASVATSAATGSCAPEDNATPLVSASIRPLQAGHRLARAFRDSRGPTYQPPDVFVPAATDTVTVAPDQPKPSTPGAEAPRSTAGRRLVRSADLNCSERGQISPRLAPI